MAVSNKKRGLGMGLDALFDASSIEVESAGLRMVPLTEVEPSSSQPRKEFDREKLEALAESIRTHGLLQPLAVRPLQDGRYEIVAGERRWRAARMAGLTELPVRVVELTGVRQLEAALVENLQREDLGAMELSDGYRRLMEEFSLTQEQIAATVGRSRSAVANTLRLQQLSPALARLVRAGTLSEGHARALIGLPEGVALRLAQAVEREGLSVRQLEAAVRQLSREKKQPADRRPAHVQQLERTLAGSLGRKVRLTGGAKGGKLTLEYYGTDDLTALIRLLGIDPQQD